MNSSENLKAELIKNKDKTWFVFTTQPKNSQFSDLVSLIDWYNNQILHKSFKKKKLKLEAGEKTLLSGIELLPTSKIVVLGLGAEGSEISKTDATQIIKSTEEIMEQLNEKNPWFVVSAHASKDLISSIEKKFSPVTVG